MGHLTVTDDWLDGNLGVRDIVGPEVMPRVGGGPFQDHLCRGGRLALAEKQAHHTALRIR